jgi:hypothetical protein
VKLIAFSIDRATTLHFSVDMCLIFFFFLALFSWDGKNERRMVANCGVERFLICCGFTVFVAKADNETISRTDKIGVRKFKIPSSLESEDYPQSQ